MLWFTGGVRLGFGSILRNWWLNKRISFGVLLIGNGSFIWPPALLANAPRPCLFVRWQFIQNPEWKFTLLCMIDQTDWHTYKGKSFYSPLGSYPTVPTIYHPPSTIHHLLTPQTARDSQPQRTNDSNDSLLFSYHDHESRYTTTLQHAYGEQSSPNCCPYLHISTAHPTGRASDDVGRPWSIVTRESSTVLERCDDLARVRDLILVVEAKAGREGSRLHTLRGYFGWERVWCCQALWLIFMLHSGGSGSSTLRSHQKCYDRKPCRLRSVLADGRTKHCDSIGCRERVACRCYSTLSVMINWPPTDARSTPDVRGSRRRVRVRTLPRVHRLY